MVRINLKKTVKTRGLLLIVLLGMTGVIVLSVLLAAFGLVSLSHMFARVNPELAHMRVPVLALCQTAVILFILACVISLAVVIQVWRDRAYTMLTVRLLEAMSICFFMMLSPLIALILYTEANVDGSITNLWALLGIALILVAGSIFAVFANLVNQGRLYKEDADLTI